MQVILNFTRYDLISVNGDERFLTLVLNTNSDLDQIRYNAETHEGYINVVDGDTVIKEYKGYEHFTSIKSNGDTVLIFQQVYNYEEALTIIFGKPLSIFEAEEKKEEILELAEYAPDDVAYNNRWAYPEWEVGMHFKVGDKCNHSLGFYKSKVDQIASESHQPGQDTYCWQEITAPNGPTASGGTMIEEEGEF